MAHRGGLFDSLRNAASAVKKSPQTIRRAFASAKKRMGGSKEYSNLDNCEANGWLHSDDRIVIGVSYNVKYLGTMEIEFVPNNPSANNKIAVETMRILQTEVDSKGEPQILTISAGRVTLTSVDHTQISLRHSTSRIAYSTVDTINKRLFCYVAMACRGRTALCHVFLTDSPRKSYELTFTCAQAFDYNFKQWQVNRGVAKMKAQVSETGDIDPAQPRKSPLISRKQMNLGAEHAADRTTSALSTSVTSSPHSLAPPSRSTDATPSTEPEQPRILQRYHPSDRVGNAGDDVHDEALEDDDVFFATIAAARSEPHMLDIGIDPEDFNSSST